jgi:hypothetical protein
MIVVKMTGGLGNKMFQYALYKSIIASGKEALIDDSSFNPSWDFEIIKLPHIFLNATYEIASIKLIKQFGGENNFKNKVKRRLNFLFKKKFIGEKSLSYNPLISGLNGDYFLSGLWQSEKYFNGYSQLIKHSFQFKAFADEKNILLSNEMSQGASVAIHIRKGADYERKNVIGTCDINYYKRAVEYIQKRIKDPYYYIFTDNVQWVSEHIKDINYTLIDWNPVSGVENYLDMQLMSCCKHNIIANSTYSWWGAWLNGNPDKLVLCPKIWYNKSSGLDTNDLIPESWIKL